MKKPQSISWVATGSAVLVLLLLLQVAAVAAGANDGFTPQADEGDAGQELVVDPSNPAGEVGGDASNNVFKITEEGQLFKLRKAHDVVVVLVTQEFDCATCSDAKDMFVGAATRVEADADDITRGDGIDFSNVSFAILDAQEHADEFHAMMEENPDYHWYVPQIFLFKAEHQFEMKRPPVLFAMNDNIEADLPMLVGRLVGPAPMQLTTAESLLGRITSDVTEGVSFAVWGGSVPAPLKRLLEKERLNTLFHQLPAVADADAELVRKYNKAKAPFVAYVYRGDRPPASDEESVEDDPFVSQLPLSVDFENDDFSIIMEKLTRFIDKVKTWRPGHEYDLVTRFSIKDVQLPRNMIYCNATKSRKGDSIRVRITARLLETNVALFRETDVQFIVGEPPLPPAGGEAGQQDEEPAVIPPIVPKRALKGLCAGMKRDIVIPAGSAYREMDERPTRYDEQQRVLVHVEVVEVENASEREAAQQPNDGDL